VNQFQSLTRSASWNLPLKLFLGFGLDANVTRNWVGEFLLGVQLFWQQFPDISEVDMCKASMPGLDIFSDRRGYGCAGR